jgi:hypothetical protein
MDIDAHEHPRDSHALLKTEIWAQGKIGPGQLIVMPLSIPAGTAQADFRLSWREDWGSYPLNDLDLILVRPNGTASFAGATLNSPESVSVTNPAAGVWTVLLHGFEINTSSDKYELRIALDGKVIKWFGHAGFVSLKKECCSERRRK